MKNKKENQISYWSPEKDKEVTEERKRSALANYKNYLREQYRKITK